MIKILGLDICADTPIGEMLDGLSTAMYQQNLQRIAPHTWRCTW
jgi:hypothetical protein